MWGVQCGLECLLGCSKAPAAVFMCAARGGWPNTLTLCSTSSGTQGSAGPKPQNYGVSRHPLVSLHAIFHLASPPGTRTPSDF